MDCCELLTIEGRYPLKSVPLKIVSGETDYAVIVRVSCVKQFGRCKDR